VRPRCLLLLWAGQFGGLAQAWSSAPAGRKYPLVTSIGDTNGDGVPDLYATAAAGGLVFIPGSVVGASASLSPSPVPGRTGWTSRASAEARGGPLE
jgi:hypothetical protein